MCENYNKEEAILGNNYARKVLREVISNPFLLQRKEFLFLERGFLSLST
jgi:hypothetical protein